MIFRLPAALETSHNEQMLSIRSRIVLVTATALFAFLGPLRIASSPILIPTELPRQLSDEAFWNMVTEFSEPGGYFRSDNFVSNETTFQYVLKNLRKTKPGGVYLGVGPDQNFTYIVAMQPRLAVIFDIRRQNAMQHLMYKAIIEMSSDRADFLSKLFSRHRPENLGPATKPEELFAAYDGITPDRQLFLQNFKAIKKQLEEHHKFNLSADDEVAIEYVYNSFYEGGPDLTYNGVGGLGFGRRMPTYAEIMEMTDEEGVNRSYMGTEENFKKLQEFENKNLIVPVVGDFAGPKAIRAVAAYLKQHDAFVGAFYVSNVEQYLFQQGDDWSKFYSNVETLPLDASSAFIRSVFNGLSLTYQPSGFGLRSASLLSSIPDVVRGFTAGEVRTYYDVINMSK
jgi:hypothetical protein